MELKNPLYASANDEDTLHLWVDRDQNLMSCAKEKSFHAVDSC